MTVIKLEKVSENTALSCFYLFLDDMKFDTNVSLIRTRYNDYLSSVMVLESGALISKLEIQHKKPYMSEEEILNIFYEGNKELIEHVFLFGGNK